MPARNEEWASASDLSEYAYCPRAWYYRKNPPSTPVSPSARRAAEAGERYHRSTLAAEQRRESFGTGYAVALLAAVVLILGGLAWLFH